MDTMEGLLLIKQTQCQHNLEYMDTVEGLLLISQTQCQHNLKYMDTVEGLLLITQTWCQHWHRLQGRVGHRILFRSERFVLFRSFKERNILFRSFLKFLATYETRKNDTFFSVLF